MTISKMIVLIAAGVVGGVLLDRSWSSATTSKAPSGTLTKATLAVSPLQVLGSIQPRGGIVEVALPPGMRPLRFGDDVAVGRHVKRDQILAYMEGYEERLKEIKVTEAEIAAAEKMHESESANEKTALEDVDREQKQASRLGKMELESLDLKIKCLEQKWLLARQQVEDVEGLQHNNTIPRQQYHQLRVQSEISLEELRYARAERERVKAELELNTGTDKIEQQKRRIRVTAERARSQIAIEPLEQKLALSRKMLQRSTILAPIDGEILEINTQPGEAGNGRPLLKLGDTSQLYVLADVNDEYGHLIEIGAEATVKGRGLPGAPEQDRTLHGIVEQISPIIGAHRQQPLDPTSRENPRVFLTWIKLDDKTPEDLRSLEELRRCILLPVNVKIAVAKVRPGEATIANRP